jgi:hypothetical protein
VHAPTKAIGPTRFRTVLELPSSRTGQPEHLKQHDARRQQRRRSHNCGMDGAGASGEYRYREPAEYPCVNRRSRASQLVAGRSRHKDQLGMGSHWLPEACGAHRTSRPSSIWQAPPIWSPWRCCAASAPQPYYRRQRAGQLCAQALIRRGNSAQTCDARASRRTSLRKTLPAPPVWTVPRSACSSVGVAVPVSRQSSN